ncbi:hypothetical protein [Winogradskyella sp. R77965]|uniref:hypothetical protein n=1 Tax=Winogradskyella sp. R77965 TaxID=3093872 RepID=UPI0037DC9DC9
MKHLKTNILQKFILIFSLTLIFVSCSSEETKSEDFNSKDFKKESKFVIDSYNLLEQDFNNTLAKSTELNQQQIDQHLEKIGLEAGSVTVQSVNQILKSISVATQEDVEFAINQTTYTSLTKNKLVEISRGEVVNDLNSIPGFNQLDITEKEILTFSNEIAIEYLNNNSNSLQKTDVPCPSSACGVGFAIVGATAGSAICGLPCGIAGGIIGLIIGTAGK